MNIVFVEKDLDRANERLFTYVHIFIRLGKISYNSTRTSRSIGYTYLHRNSSFLLQRAPRRHQQPPHQPISDTRQRPMKVESPISPN